MHFTTAYDLLFPYDRYVVLSLACDHTGIATRALIQVDRHTPLVILIDGGLFPKRLVFEVVLDDRPGELRILFVLKVSSFANQLRGPLGCFR